MLNSLGVNILYVQPKKILQLFKKIFKGLDQSGVTKLYVRKAKNITTFSKKLLTI
jgi:hypothetical protein